MASLSTTSSSSSSAGIDVQATVEQILYAERAGERLLQARQTTLQRQATALEQVQTQLGTLGTSIEALQDTAGVLNSKTVSSSDSNVVTATTSASAESGNHTLVVTRLATTSTYYSEPITGSTKLTHGTFSISVAGGSAVDVTVTGSNDTVAGLANHINGLNAGVTASAVNDANGTRLVIVSGKSGNAGQIRISGGSVPFAMTQGSEGLNAKFTLDGIPLESATNSVNNVLPGLTLSLKQSSLSEVLLTVGADTERSRQAITDFISAYNVTVKGINAQFAYDSASGSAGILAGDSMIRSLQAGLLSNATYSIKDGTGITSLSGLGIRMENDGTLTVDSDELGSVLELRIEDVQNFFQASADGFAKRFGASIDAMTDPIDGIIQVDINGNKFDQDNLGDQIESYEVRMEMRQRILLDQFSRIDTLLRQFASTQAQVSAELGSLE